MFSGFYKEIFKFYDKLFVKQVLCINYEVNEHDTKLIRAMDSLDQVQNLYIKWCISRNCLYYAIREHVVCMKISWRQRWYIHKVLSAFVQLNLLCIWSKSTRARKEPIRLDKLHRVVHNFKYTDRPNMF